MADIARISIAEIQQRTETIRSLLNKHIEIMNQIQQELDVLHCCFSGEALGEVFIAMKQKYDDLCVEEKEVRKLVNEYIKMCELVSSCFNPCLYGSPDSFENGLPDDVL